MNCHGQQESQTENGHAKHGSWMMLVCCAVPLVLIGAAVLFGYRGALTGLLILLCPLMHVGMMVWLARRSRHDGHEPPADRTKPEKLEETL